MSKNLWSSKLNFVLVTIGAAVGLGSIWKFPYMAGDNGGSAFVLFYLFATFIIGVPIMIAEIILGKIARSNPITAMRKLAIKENASKNWQSVGYVGAVALVLVLAFYSVIAGWSIAYMVKAWTGELKNLSNTQINAAWGDFIGNPIQLLLWHSIFMFLTLWVVAKGIHKGLERASRIMMPGLFVVLVILMFYSSMFGDFKAAFKFLFTPDFSKLTPKLMIDALGQAAFSLATGAGAMIVYGSYCSKDTKVAHNVLIIASSIIVVSVLSGLAIFPIVFGFGLDPQGGPGLMFQVLPLTFNQMPFGNFFGGLFFLMLFFAGWTSSISMAEPLVVILIEKTKLKRHQAAAIVGAIAWGFGILALLSFNTFSDFKILGKYTLFTSMTDLVTNILLPFGALAFAIFAGWRLNKTTAKNAIVIKSKLGFKLWQVLVRYIAPIGIVVLFIHCILYPFN